MDKAVLNILIKAQDEASKVIKDIGKNVDNAKKQLDGMSKGLMIAGGAMTGAGIAGVAILKDWVNTSAEAETQMAKFNAKLNASFGSTPKLMNEIKESALETSKAFIKLGFDDEMTANAFLNLASKTKDAQKATELMGLASDMARSKGISLLDATEQISRILMGKGNRALLEYGIVAKEGGNATEYLAQIQKKVSGQAEAYAGTLIGSQERLAITFQNIREELGSKLLPVITQVASAFLNVIDTLNNINPNLLATIGVIVGLGSAFALIAGPITFLIGFLPVLSGAFIGLLGILTPILPIIIAIAGAGLLIWSNWNILVTFFQTMVLPILQQVWAELSNFWLIIYPLFSQALTNLYTLWSIIFTLISSVVMSILKSLWAFFGDWIKLVINVFKLGWDLLKIVVEIAWKAIQSIILLALSVLSLNFNTFLNSLKTIWGGTWDSMKSKLASVWEGIKSVVRSGVNMVIDLINGLINALNSIKINIPSVSIGGVKIKGFSWGGMGIPNIPHLATGGFINSDGLAYLHKGETVLPASVSKNINNYNNKNNSINIQAIINTPLDWDLIINNLNYRLNYSYD